MDHPNRLLTDSDLVQLLMRGFVRSLRLRNIDHIDNNAYIMRDEEGDLNERMCLLYRDFNTQNVLCLWVHNGGTNSVFTYGHINFGDLPPSEYCDPTTNKNIFTIIAHVPGNLP